MRESEQASNNALTNSWRIQSEASALGFDWPDARGVLDKIAEELSEIREALGADDLAHAQRELGDLLLAAVNLSRFLEIDPSEALTRANIRFSERFEIVKEKVGKTGREMKTCSLDELNAFWEHAKALTQQQPRKGP